MRHCVSSGSSTANLDHLWSVVLAVSNSGDSSHSYDTEVAGSSQSLQPLTFENIIRGRDARSPPTFDDPRAWSPLQTLLTAVELRAAEERGEESAATRISSGRDKPTSASMVEASTSGVLTALKRSAAESWGASGGCGESECPSETCTVISRTEAGPSKVPRLNLVGQEHQEHPLNLGVKANQGQEQQPLDLLRQQSLDSRPAEKLWHDLYGNGKPLISWLAADLIFDRSPLPNFRKEFLQVYSRKLRDSFERLREFDIESLLGKGSVCDKTKRVLHMLEKHLEDESQFFFTIKAAGNLYRLLDLVNGGKKLQEWETELFSRAGNDIYMGKETKQLLIFSWLYALLWDHPQLRQLQSAYPPDVIIVLHEGDSVKNFVSYIDKAIDKTKNA